MPRQYGQDEAARDGAERRWPASGGEMSALVRAHDWASTPLGPVGEWPCELKTAVEIALDCQLPMIVLWGPELIQIYNDAYCSLMDQKHPAGLGQPTRECWPEVWDINEPIYARVWRGEAVTLTDQLFPITRHGYLEQTYFTVCYSPLRDGTGAVAGALVTVFETTERLSADAQRRRTEESLRASEERLRFVMDSAELGTWDWNVITGELIWSERSFQLFGLEPGTEMNYERFMSAVHPDDRDRVEAAVRRTLEQRLTHYEIEVRSIWPDGSVHWVSTRGRCYQDSSGRIVRVSGVSFDTTGRKRAEEAMRESEERLRLLIEGAELGTWDWDLISDTVVWSDRSFALFGLPPGTEMNWERFMASVHPDDRDRVTRMMRRSVDLGAEYEVELRCVWPDGSVHWVHSRGRCYEDRSGRPVRMSGVAFDVTDRRRAEEAVRESEERLRLLVENVREYALIQHDAEGKITDWNPGAERLFGYSAADMAGSSLLVLLTPEERDAGLLRGEIARVSEGGRSELEGWMVRKDGSRFWASCVTEAVRDASGRLRGFAKIVRDETERRRAAEVTLQRQKLQSVGLLAGGIAHDFNILLTGITGNASLIVDEIPTGPSRRVRQILDSAERAAHLTRQLLAYSGKGQFLLQEVNLADAVQEVGELVQFSVPKSVDFEVKPASLLPPVEIDPNQLQQILMNLVINAGEAIGEGNAGKISLETGMLDVDRPFVDAIGQEVVPGRYVWVEVRDTGVGIAPENLSEIFDPFFTTKFTGRGLGLAAVAGIIRAQKGAITVESSPGRGSAFRVYLPAAGAGASAPREPAAGGTAVLVVDEEDTVRDVARAVLSRQGYRVLTAANAREALATLNRESANIRAVVLDVAAPVMGTQELLPVLRARHPEVKVLITSGYDEAEARRLSGAGQEAAFIAKPFTASQMAAAVRALIGNAK